MILNLLKRIVLKPKKMISEKRKPFDLTEHHEECPICLSQLEHNSEHKYDYYEGNYTIDSSSCKNGCYTKRKETCEIYYDFWIFNKCFRTYRTSQEEVWGVINDWIKDEKYMMEIMLKN